MMNYSEFIMEYQPFKNTDNFIDIEYNRIIQRISTCETRKEVMFFKRTMTKILQDFNFWGNVKYSKWYKYNLLGSNDSYDKRFESSNFRDSVIINIRNACARQLVNIEKYEPFKEMVFNKKQEIIEYLKYGRLFTWEFVFAEKPSIHIDNTNYLNQKIYDRGEFLYSDYFFMFPNIKLTKFGYDNFESIVDELSNIIEMRHKQPENLILKYYYKFRRENSRYCRNFQKLTLKGSYDYRQNNYLETFSVSTIEEIGKYFENYSENMELFEEQRLEIIKSENYPEEIKFKGVVFHNVVQLSTLINDYYRTAENAVRENRNLPAVNEGWISETNLFYEVEKHLRPLKVFQHASPKFLGKQHLDIFIPYLEVGIEYQGKQHFEPVDYFGGEETFLQTIERDKRKKTLCEENGIRLIYVEENYDLDSLLDLIDNIREERKLK